MSVVSLKERILSLKERLRNGKGDESKIIAEIESLESKLAYLACPFKVGDKVITRLWKVYKITKILPGPHEYILYGTPVPVKKEKGKIVEDKKGKAGSERQIWNEVTLWKKAK